MPLLWHWELSCVLSQEGRGVSCLSACSEDGCKPEGRVALPDLAQACPWPPPPGSRGQRRLGGSTPQDRVQRALWLWPRSPGSQEGQTCEADR